MAKAKLMLDLFEKNLQNLYNSEDLILKSFPKMLHHVTDETLKEVVEFYQVLTDAQKERLVEIGAYLKVKIAVSDGNIIRALIEDVTWLYNEFPKGLLMDVGIVSKLKHIQHFQISAYENAVLYAKHLKIREVTELLNKSLEEAYEGDEVCSYHANRLLKNTKINDGDDPE
ncbi:MAG: DUF892 family protein [Aquaticitalea sp.]